MQRHEPYQPWKFTSNYPKQVALAFAAVSIGVTLLIGFRNFDASGMSNSLAGFLLGLLLLVIGVIALLTQGRQTIVIDPRMRLIIMEEMTPLGIKKRLIRFDDIVDTRVGYLGKKANFVNMYYIKLHLRNGKAYSLFSPGRFYDGGSDRYVMETRRQQLEQLLKQDASMS
jgi:hypothetical protein